MIVTSRRDRNSGDAKVAGTSRSPLLRLPMRSEFFRPSKNQELLAPAAPDCAWFKSIEQDLRRRARLEAECLAEFNQPAALSTYQRGKSVRTTRATAGFRNERLSAIRNILSFLHCDKSSGTAFPPFHAKFLADTFLPKEGDGVVVDPCAGWGGRLLGTLCVKRTGHVHYYGIDPEKRNKPAYEGLERRVNIWLKEELKGTRSARIFYKPFEDWIRSKSAKSLFGKVDLMLTR